MLLEQDEEFTVVGCAQDGREAVEMTSEYHPDVILMDLKMPLYSGFDAIHDIKSCNEAVKILVLTVDADEKSITTAFINGADGYVLKDIAPPELFLLLKKVFMGEKYTSESGFSIGDEIIRDKNDRKEDLTYVQVEFTAREKEVLDLVIVGMTNEEIAGELGISAGRARNIVGELISKCMVKNRTQLAVIAVKIKMHTGNEGGQL